MLPDLSLLGMSALTVVGIATLVGFYSGHLVRRVRLPSLIGYMVVGVILGPSVLHLFESEHMESLSFITEIALGFVAFSIGATVITTITATSIFFEIIGPICTKVALSKAGEIPGDHTA